ncbi:MAG: ribonuclease R [Rhodospirillales bacterium]
MSAKPSKPPSPFPSREQIVEYVNSSPQRIGKREIARAFRLDAEQKLSLKRVLKELEAEGAIERGRRRRYHEPGTLPSVAVVEITGIDGDGELVGRPLGWTEEAPAPVVTLVPEARSRSALAPGERALVRLRRIDPGSYEGQVIRRLAAAPARALGIYEAFGAQGRIRPIDRRAREEFVVAPGDSMDCAPGELVRAEVRPGRPLGLRHARVVERLGPAQGPRAISLITIHDHDIPTRFADEAMRQADACGPAPMAERADLRSMPLVTIDGADARDFDDAVWAEPDPDPTSPGGWQVVVAIADVGWYVRPGEALDRAAFERGNSVYFPDRVVPMLPEALSNGWCSLVPGEDRPCLAAHLRIGADGTLIGHRFVRAMMRSAARLTYTQVQEARDGRADDTTGPLVDAVIAPLYGAYAALAGARARRGVLELDLAERRVVIGEDGTVARVETRERFDSHKLIEEFMIAANVAAAETLEKRKRPCVYRIHDQPSRDKLEALRQFLDTLGIRFSRGQVVRAKDLNQILDRAQGRPEARMINEVVLRTQAQAVYAPTNIGHFGLALRRYCHFTSPIRRYADLLVHRALIAALGLGAGGHGSEGADLDRVSEHISTTERRAAAAERDAVDRFTAAYLADKVGATFAGRINGVTRFGLFVTLDDSGGDGLVPIGSLPDDYYVHDEKSHRLVGRTTGRAFRLGDAVTVRLAEANPITGGLILELTEGGGRPTRGPRRPGGGRGGGRIGGRRGRA